MLFCFAQARISRNGSEHKSQSPMPTQVRSAVTSWGLSCKRKKARAAIKPAEPMSRGSPLSLVLFPSTTVATPKPLRQLAIFSLHTLLGVPITRSEAFAPCCSSWATFCVIISNSSAGVFPVRMVTGMLVAVQVSAIFWVPSSWASSAKPQALG